MKITILVALSAAAVVQGFAPAKLEGRPATDLKKSLFDTVSDMDLFNTNGVGSGLNRNAYGARNNKIYKKNLSTGKISKNSYVPSGMTREQYSQLRTQETKYKDQSYQRNVDKNQVFSRFFDFYKNRGTDNVDNWRSVTNGHTMAKTKYDWDNVNGQTAQTTASKKQVGGKKKTVKKTPTFEKNIMVSNQKKPAVNKFFSKTQRNSQVKTIYTKKS